MERMLMKLFHTDMAIPPAYHQSLFALLSADHQVTKRVALVPHYNISAVQEIRGKVTLAVRTPTTPELYIPPNLTFDQFTAIYCPGFRKFTDHATKTRIAINPKHMVLVHQDDKNRTLVVVDSMETYAIDYAKQVKVYKTFTVDEELTEVGRAFDQAGMHQTLSSAYS
jgi:hypothetical protein